MKTAKEIADVLKEAGVCKVGSFFSEDSIANLRKSVKDVFINKGGKVKPPMDLSGLGNSDIKAGGKNFKCSPISQSATAAGPSSYRELTNSARLRQPILAVPSLADFALNEFFIDTADSYLGDKSQLNNIDVRMHFVNDLPGFDVNFFHHDDNLPSSHNFFKVFIPLTIAGCIEDGLTQYIPKSYRRNFAYDFINEYGHFTGKHADLEKAYGKDPIVSLTSRPGDIYMADTLNGLHRGTKPITEDRFIVIINYGKIPEYGKKRSKLKIPEGKFKNLSKKQQESCRHLVIEK